MTKKNEIINSEEIAIAAISFLASDLEQLTRFMSLTGIDPSSLREIAKDQEFLVAVLEYLMSDESLLITFSSQAGISPFDVTKARDRLANQI